jgi:hypothetical protein
MTSHALSSSVAPSFIDSFATFSFLHAFTAASRAATPMFSPLILILPMLLSALPLMP